MKTLTNIDLRFVVSRIPRDVRNAMIDRTLYVGGGFIRETIAGNPVHDVDMFGESVESLKSIADYIQLGRENSKTHVTKNAITLICPPRLPLQFISRWTFDNVDDLVQSFDFTVCQAAVYFDRATRQWMSVIGDTFYSDLAARRLVYTFPKREEEAGGSMLRVRKFVARGYNIQAESLAGVISRLALSVNFENAMGVGEGNKELGVSRIITGLLREVDPLLMLDGFELVDEHDSSDEA